MSIMLSGIFHKRQPSEIEKWPKIKGSIRTHENLFLFCLIKTKEQGLRGTIPTYIAQAFYYPLVNLKWTLWKESRKVEKVNIWKQPSGQLTGVFIIFKMYLKSIDYKIAKWKAMVN